MVVKEKEVQKFPKVLPGYSGGRMLGRSTQESGGENEQGRKEPERKNRKEVTQKVVENIKQGASARKVFEPTLRRNSQETCQAKVWLFASRR